MNPIVVSAEQIKGSPKKVGSVKNGSIYHILLHGGLNLILAKTINGSRILGMGNHVAVAKAVAQDKDPSIVFDELSKSEDLTYDSYKHLIPFYSEYTDKVNIKLEE